MLICFEFLFREEDDASITIIDIPAHLQNPWNIYRFLKILL